MFLIASLVEYIVHRLMHRRIMLGDVHLDHHKKGFGQGFLIEFKDYIVPSAPAIVFFFLWDWLVFNMLYLGIVSAVGGILYSAFAAYAHQIQHEYPEMAVWMRRPVHHIHHEYK